MVEPPTRRLRRCLAMKMAMMSLVLAAAPAAAATWTVDPAKSHIEFVGGQTGEPFRGRFGTFSAAIDFDPARPQAGHATVEIDVASARTGEAARDESMPQGDWFDVAKFPKAVFEAKSFAAKGGDAFDAVGSLTIRDKTLPMTLPFTLTIADGVAHAKGHVDLMRNAFGVGQGQYVADDYVAYKVTVEIDLTARAAAGR
jgi:polyisoprenoid-binding protein YceI